MADHKGLYQSSQTKVWAHLVVNRVLANFGKNSTNFVALQRKSNMVNLLKLFICSTLKTPC